jgi:hypothetical protein
MKRKKANKSPLPLQCVACLMRDMIRCTVHGGSEAPLTEQEDAGVKVHLLRCKKAGWAKYRAMHDYSTKRSSDWKDYPANDEPKS